MGKKKEGNEQQKRQAARAARRMGRSPSEVAETSGASKQRHHLPAHREQIRARRDRSSDTEQIGLIPARAMQQEQRRRVARLARLESMGEVQFHADIIGAVDTRKQKPGRRG